MEEYEVFREAYVKPCRTFMLLALFCGILLVLLYDKSGDQLYVLYKVISSAEVTLDESEVLMLKGAWKFVILMVNIPFIVMSGFFAIKFLGELKRVNRRALQAVDINCLMPELEVEDCMLVEQIIDQLRKVKPEECQKANVLLQEYLKRSEISQKEKKMSISEFSEVLKQQEQVLDVTVPVMATLGATYLTIVGGYLAVQKVRKKIVDETDKKRVVIVVSITSTLLLAVAAALVINIMQRMNRVIQTFREGATSWMVSVGTEDFCARMLTLNSEYSILYWCGVVVIGLLIAMCLFLIWRAKHIHGEMQKMKLLIQHTESIVAITSSIVPEYNQEDKKDMV